MGHFPLEHVPLEHGLILSAILFAIGFCGVMVRRNFLFMLMSLEIMMNAAALAFVVAGSRWVSPDGQIMFILVIQQVLEIWIMMSFHIIISVKID